VGWEEGMSQLRDLGEIDIHPLKLAVIKPLELRRQARPEAEHLSVGAMVEKVAYELVQDQTAFDQAPQHLPIGFEWSEVASEMRGDCFCRWISKALVGKEAAGERAGGQGNEQGLRDAAQTRNRASGVRLVGQYRARSLDSGEARARGNLDAPANSRRAFAQSRKFRSCIGIALASTAAGPARTSSRPLEGEVRRTGSAAYPVRRCCSEQCNLDHRDIAQ
jgi:hypothetical protein